MIHKKFRSQIKERYFAAHLSKPDVNFKFRKKMLYNVPYFSNLNDDVITELVYLLRPRMYQKGSVIVKRGDATDKLFFLKSGIVDVEVPLHDDKLHFDTLNTGSCFCVYSSFH